MIRVVKAELKSSAHRHYGGGRFFDYWRVQLSWTTLAGASPVAVIASEPRS